MHKACIAVAPRAEFRNRQPIGHAPVAGRGSYRLHIIKCRISAVAILASQSLLKMNVADEDMGRSVLGLYFLVTANALIGAGIRTGNRGHNGPDEQAQYDLAGNSHLMTYPNMVMTIINVTTTTPKATHRRDGRPC